MSHWNYRLVRHSCEGADDWYAIHEVYYNDAGEPDSMTCDPVNFGGDTPNDVISALSMALKDALERPIFDPPWGEEPRDLSLDVDKALSD